MQAPQSMHVAGSMYSCSAVVKSGSPGRGRMHWTGHTGMHELSLQQLPVITYVTVETLGSPGGNVCGPRAHERPRGSAPGTLSPS